MITINDDNVQLMVYGIVVYMVITIMMLSLICVKLGVSFR
jgi:hypothetical protein